MTFDLMFIANMFSATYKWLEQYPALLIAVAVGIFLHTFFALYVLVTALYRAHLDKVLTKVGYFLGYPWLALAAVVDVIAQFTIFSILFLEPPQEFLVTTRLRRHLLAGEEVAGWRYRISKTICSKLLDYFDPRGGHCIPLKD